MESYYYTPNNRVSYGLLKFLWHRGALIIYEKETEGGRKKGIARSEVSEHKPPSNLLLWSVELERMPAKSGKCMIVGTINLLEYFPKDLRNIY